MVRKVYLFAALLLLTGRPVWADPNTGTVSVTGHLLTSACTISGGADLTFNLGRVLTSDLPSIGSTYGRLSQNISLSCDEGTIVHVTVSGTAQSNDDTILINTGTAEGIGIQLLDVNDNDTPIEMGKEWTPITSASTGDVIPIAAQYIRTGSSLAAGAVTANATYTLEYE